MGAIPTLGNISQADLLSFQAKLHASLGQSRPRLFGNVISEVMQGSDTFIQGVGTLTARKITGTNPTSNPQEANFWRRKCVTERSMVEVIVDKKEARQLVVDPNSSLIREAMSAAYRSMDKTGTEACFADVSYGRLGASTITFASDGGRTINATGGITYDLWKDITDYFHKKEIGLDGGVQIMFAGTEQEVSQLSKLTQLTSRDFERAFMSTFNGPNGVMDSAMGVKLLQYGSDPDGADPILDVTSGTRDCIALTNTGLEYRVGQNLEVEVIDCKETYVDSTIIRVKFDVGAVRVRGAEIIKFQTTAS